VADFWLGIDGFGITQAHHAFHGRIVARDNHAPE
jgi:hypothetical protein